MDSIANIISRDAAKAMGKRHADIALDQKDEFGTVKATIEAYRENLADTLDEMRMSSWADVALDAYDRHIIKATN